MILNLKTLKLFTARSFRKQQMWGDIPSKFCNLPSTNWEDASIKGGEGALKSYLSLQVRLHANYFVDNLYNYNGLFKFSELLLQSNEFNENAGHRKHLSLTKLTQLELG